MTSTHIRAALILRKHGWYALREYADHIQTNTNKCWEHFFEDAKRRLTPYAYEEGHKILIQYGNEEIAKEVRANAKEEGLDLGYVSTLGDTEIGQAVEEQSEWVDCTGYAIGDHRPRIQREDAYICNGRIFCSEECYENWAGDD